MVPVMVTVHEHDDWGMLKAILQVEKVHQSACALALCLLFAQIHAHIEKPLYSTWIIYRLTDNSEA